MEEVASPTRRINGQFFKVPTSYVLRPASYILHHASYVLRPTSHTSTPLTSHILHPILHPTSYILQGGP